MRNKLGKTTLTVASFTRIRQKPRPHCWEQNIKKNRQNDRVGCQVEQQNWLKESLALGSIADSAANAESPHAKATHPDSGQPLKSPRPLLPGPPNSTVIHGTRCCSLRCPLHCPLSHPPFPGPQLLSLPVSTVVHCIQLPGVHIATTESIASTFASRVCPFYQNNTQTSEKKTPSTVFSSSKGGQQHQHTVPFPFRRLLADFTRY